MLVLCISDDAARQWARMGYLGLFERKRRPSRQPGPSRTWRQLVCRVTCGRSAVIYSRELEPLQALANELRAGQVQLRVASFWKLVLIGSQVGPAVKRATKASEVKTEK